MRLWVVFLSVVLAMVSSLIILNIMLTWVPWFPGILSSTA